MPVSTVEILPSLAVLVYAAKGRTAEPGRDVWCVLRSFHMRLWCGDSFHCKEISAVWFNWRYLKTWPAWNSVVGLSPFTPAAICGICSGECSECQHFESQKDVRVHGRAVHKSYGTFLPERNQGRCRMASRTDSFLLHRLQ